MNKNIITLKGLLFHFTTFFEKEPTYGVWNWKIDFFKNNYIKRAKKLNSILDKKCDVTSLQEVWLKEFWKEIKSPYKTSFLASNGKSIGSSFLTQTALLNVYQHNFRLSSPGLGRVIRDLPFVNVGKGFSYGAKKIKNSKLHLINVHLHPGFTNNAKATRASQLLELVRFIVNNKFSSEAVIIMGDFNANTRSVELRFLEDVFGFKGRESFEGECTFVGPGRILCQSIDFILYKNGPRLSLESVSNTLQDLSENEFISDHKLLKQTFNYYSFNNTNSEIPLTHLESYQRYFKELFESAGSRYNRDIILLDKLVNFLLLK